jgi:hypothetical protein
MPDTVDDIDHQIQQLIQQKKRLSNVQNSSAVKASSQSTAGKGQFAKNAGEVEDRTTRGYSGHKGIEGTHTTKLASQEVCKPRVIELHSKIGSSGANLQ